MPPTTQKAQPMQINQHAKMKSYKVCLWVCVCLGGGGWRRREAQETSIWRMLCQTWISQKCLNIIKKNNSLPLKWMKERSSVILQKFLGCKVSLGVYSSFNYSSQALRKGLLPGKSLLPSINTCRKMDYEAVKTFIYRVKEKQTRIFSQIKTF